jgi:low temperature requirement protein LtrA
MSIADRIEQELEVEQRVTALELFFDLVFVFAITQITGFVSADPTWTRLFEGLAILAVLWWAWVAYAWLANNAASDEGPVRVTLLAAMGAMLVASLAVPKGFGADALVFGIAYFTVRALHLVAYVIIGRDDPSLLAVVARLASTIMPAAALIVLAGALDGTPQALCWVAALVIDYGGLMLRGIEGWRVEPSHFVERYGLIVIIALGESIVSVGVGAQGLGLGAGVIVGALFGVATAAAMWWAYFDVVAMVAERRFRRLDPVGRARLARDSYSYLHLPMVAGIILFALGVKKVLAHVGADMHVVPAVALCGGVALYLVAMSAFKRRNVGSWNRPRLVSGALLAILAPIATDIPALLSLGLVTAIACGDIAVEVVIYAEARERIRHGG